MSGTRRACDERCLCGNLLARATPEGVEILCRRCKRVHCIPWGTVSGAGPPPKREAARSAG